MNTIRISDDVEWREFGKECLILNLSNGFYFRLNDTGSFLWKLISKGKNIDTLVQKMIEEFDVDEKTARKDIKSFLDNMKKENLLTF